MSVLPQQWKIWQSEINSTNLTDVLNAMNTIKDCGDPAAITLLQEAGRNIAPHFKRMTIRLPEGPVNFEEFRRRCITALLGEQKTMSQKKPKVFISYNHQDETYATKLALELRRSPDIDVFIDHWDMSAGD
jgi:hypothetical protein